jgi:WD40 repeat protein/serine/threonine protein kinase
MDGPEPKLRELFSRTLQCQNAEAQAAYLEQACHGNAELRARLEELLQAHREAGSFLHEPSFSRIATVDEPPLTEQPGTVVGPYKLLQQIGEGGMGIVYMAEQEHPVRRRAALKIIKPGMDSKQIIARFEAERQALAMMDHTNIAKVFDAGTVGQAFQPDTPSPSQAGKPDLPGGRPYFVMELVHGMPITQFCDGNRLTPRERLELFVPVCQAIQHAHQKGIIHRDVKPSNVLVTMYDDKPVPKVIDFGVAKAIEQRLTEKTLFTQFGVLVGTFEYMSPEQADMNALGVDSRSDIYSLGVLLYELLTGTTPLQRERLHEAALDEVLRVIKEEEPPRPSVRLSSSDTLPKIAAARKTEPAKLSKLVRGELDWIVMKCLEKDRSRRFETANGLARDVERYLHDEPVEACPPSVGYRLGKFARKYRMILIAATTIALLLLVGVFVSAWQAVRARIAEAGSRRLSYTGSMGLVQAAWEDHNILRVRDLLAQTADFAERGFEWYYWQRLCRVEHLTLAGHKGGVTALAFAPDGQRLVTAVTDGTALVWDATNGQELFCLAGHRSEVTSVAYAPDGKWLVTGSTDGTARIWDAAGGRQLWMLQAQNSGPIWAVAVTPHSKRVVTGNQDGTARVWDAASGRELLTLQGHTALPVLGASIVGLLGSSHAHGPILIASAVYAGGIGKSGSLMAVAVTGDGKWLITGSTDGTAKMWAADTGIHAKTFDHQSGISAVAVARDGMRLVTGSGNGLAKIWDMESGTVVRTVPWGHGDVLSLAITPDGHQLLTGYWGGMANVRDMASGREILTLMGHSLLVSCVAVSPDGQRLATGSLDGTARVWDTAGGRGTRTLKVDNVPFGRVAATPDGQRLVARSPDGRFNVWDPVSGRKLQSLKGQTDRFWFAAITPDGQRIVTGEDPESQQILTGGEDGTAAVWDAATGGMLRSFKTHNDGTWSLTLTADGQRIVIGGGDGTARVWDGLSGRELLSLKGHIGPVWSVAVTADGRRLVTGGQDGKVKIWDAFDGRELQSLRGHTYRVLSVAITPDGQRILTNGGDGTTRVWDVVSGRELLSLKGHIEPGLAAAVTPDGRRLVTGNGDGTVAVWDAVTGREVLTLKGHTGPVRSVAVTSDGLRLITGSDDGTVKIWEAATPAQVALWTKQEQEAAQRQKLWQRPVEEGPGFIHDWLVLAPLPLEPDRRGANGLNGEQLPGEPRLEPRAGDRVSVDGREYTWKAYHEKEPILNFNRFVGKLSRNSLAYAVCYVISEEERQDLLLQVGCDGHAKLYLNGNEISKYIPGRSLMALQSVGPVALRKGVNLMVIKSVSGNWNWLGCLRLVDPHGNPAVGLRVSLTPE